MHALHTTNPTNVVLVFIVTSQVNQEKLEVLQQRTMALDYPLLAEYDFR